jgi:hypothetical protein
MLPEVAKYLKSKLWQLRFDGEASVVCFGKQVSITRASIAAKLLLIVASALADYPIPLPK